MRFGVGINTDHTLEVVGLQFSVTRERIKNSKKRNGRSKFATCNIHCQKIHKQRFAIFGFNPRRKYWTHEGR